MSNNGVVVVGGGGRGGGDWRVFKPPKSSITTKIGNMCYDLYSLGCPAL